MRCNPNCHRGARQRFGRNTPAAPARLSHRRAAGRFLFRSDAGRPVDRFVCHRNIFQIPGIGVFLVNSALNRDYTLIVGLSLLYAILLIGLNLVVDFAYTLLDPRVKYE